MTIHDPSPAFDRHDGMLPAIAQDAETGEVLMLAWMNQEAFEETLRTSRAVYFSRSRNRLWRKGEQSGHVQQVRSIHVDCDEDAILIKVDQTGVACHQGYATCFYRRVTDEGWVVDRPRVLDPADVYKET